MNSSDEFGRLYAAAKQLEAGCSRQPAALATIVCTRGSTYRRAGTSMLVRSDGSVVCPLAGGCPQHDLVLRAQQVIQRDRAQLAAYNRDSGLDVLIETGCGGELDVLIEPLSRGSDLAFFDAMQALHERRAPGVLATLFRFDGETLPRPQRLVWGGARTWTDIENAALAVRIREACVQGGERKRAVVARIASAGGVADVLLEHFDPVHRLLVFGANPGSLALAGLAASLGWKVRLFDSAEPPPGTVACVNATPDTLPRYVTGDRSTSAVVMTHNLERDVAWLRALERVPLAYLGAIGSRERAARIRAALPRLGARLHCPAGLDIGAGTPEQIAVSVIAEILSVRNRRGTANRAPAREAVTA